MRDFARRVGRFLRANWFVLAYPLALLAGPHIAAAAASTTTTSSTADAAANVGPGHIGAALNGIQSLLYKLALPAAGLGLATGGIWHTLSHDQRGQDSSKALMKASAVGAGVTILASAIIGAFGTALKG